MSRTAKLGASLKVRFEELRFYIRHELCKRTITRRQKLRGAIATTLAILLLLFYFCLPSPLFDDGYCTVLFDRDRELLAATIAPDGQYRFPPSDSVATKFATCLMLFEDAHFRYHHGINPVSIAKAAYANIRAGRIVRGGSTLTMQLARMLHPHAERSILNKLIEMVWALRLEVGYSKDEILGMYAAHAPFGGNVVGLDAATWRYYGLSPDLLSWGQAAALAVLPNAPSAIYPGRATPAFLRKRNGLLQKLHREGYIDSITLSLSLQEPLPEPPAPLPQHALQMLTHAINDGFYGQQIHSTLQAHIQQRAEEIVQTHAQELESKQIYNLAAIIAEVRTGRIIAYVGNTPGLSNTREGYVDAAAGKRSTGSLLKPFLYAAALQEGLILPQQLLADIPTKYGGYSPENSTHRYSGAVPADMALARSLNVPAVRLLQEYGLDLFLKLLPRLGLVSLNRSAGHYGLTLILGGGESSLLELTGAYASLARTLNVYTDSGRYTRGTIHPLTYLMRSDQENQPQESTPKAPTNEPPPLRAGAIYCTMKALREVGRPDEEAGWTNFSSSRAVSWKTGTSWGGRDAWAISVNPDYVIGVWGGNAQGNAFVGSSGLRGAAPLMFHLWSLLPHSPWFRIPHDDLQEQPVCHRSGYAPSTVCPQVDTILAPYVKQTHQPCPYHRMVHLDSTSRYRVNTSCYPIDDMRSEPFFVLPPTMGWYYALYQPYRQLPPWLDGCADGQEAQSPMQFIYPSHQNAKLSVPRGLDGKPTAILFEVAHQEPETTLYWHLDDSYAGQSYHKHQLSLQPAEGDHTLTVMDQNGNRQSIRFTVLYRAE